MTALFRYAGSKQASCVAMFGVMLSRCPQPARYVTPTLGSGADLYYVLESKVAPSYLASDLSDKIVAPHLATKEDCVQFIQELDVYQNWDLERCKAQYQDFKREQPTSQLQQAIRTLFLIGSSFNGLWRESKKSGFNVPFGKRFSFEPAKFLKCSQLLNSVPGTLATQDFEQTLAQCHSGDLVYIDPPFCGSSATFGGKWKEADHKRLMRCALEAKERGATVFISNSDHPDTYAWYRGPSQPTIHRIKVSRTVAAKATSRKQIEELLIEV